MYSLLYSSIASFPLSPAEVDALLDRSRDLNAAHDVSGLLLYVLVDAQESAFLQVLEGSQEAVAATFARIEQDELHHSLEVLHRGPAAERRFADWSMRFVRLDGSELVPAGPVDADRALRDREAMVALVARYA